MQIAIVTGFTHNIMSDFIHFYATLRQHCAVQLYVVPYDFNDNQLDELLEYEKDGQTTIVNIDDKLLYKYKSVNNRWPQWCKPDVIKSVRDQYNIDCLLWLDIDILVLDNICQLFEHIDKQFLVVRDYFAPISCFNDNRLYDYFKEQPNEMDLNTGVVGFMFPRDNYILDEWCNKTNLVINNLEIKDYISLYDQGCLIWAMSGLNINHMICDNIAFNYPAVRKVYDDVDRNQLYHIVKNDNHGAIIAHYAGAPKLSHILRHNCNVTKAHVKAKYGDTVRLACVGLECAGIENVCQIIDSSVKNPSYVRHNTSLAKEAKLKFDGNGYDIQPTIDMLSRSDACLVCECNYNLLHFIDDLDDNVNDIRFLLLLQHPVELIRSKLLRFCMWSQFEHLYNFNYILDYYCGNDLSANRYRITPTEIPNSIMDVYIWELITTVDIALSKLCSVDKQRFSIIWTDNINNGFRDLDKLLHGTLFWSKISDYVVKPYNTRCRNITIDWVDGIISGKKHDIMQRFICLLEKYDVNINL